VPERLGLTEDSEWPRNIDLYPGLLVLILIRMTTIRNTLWYLGLMVLVFIRLTTMSIAKLYY